MSWNGSCKCESVTQSGRNTANSRVKLLLLCCCGVVFLCVCFVIGWLFLTTSDGKKVKSPSSKTSLIEIASNKVVAATRDISHNTVAKSKITVAAGSPGNTGYSKIDYGTIITNTPIKSRQWIAERCFSCPTDRNIADFLLMKPGDSIIGEYGNYFKNFDKKFLKSLNTPIDLLESDTAEERELKEAVIEMRNELKQRLDKGENLEKTMKETWHQMKELGAYKDDIEKQVKTIMKDKRGTLSAADIEDLVNAANEMLEGRGVSKMSMPSFLVHQLKIRDNRYNKQGNAK